MQDGTPWPGNNQRDHPGMIQIRVPAVLTNGAYLLNVDCDHYFNSSKCQGGHVLYEGSCSWKESLLCSVPTEINLKGLDDIHAPVYVGTRCCFNRQALYGYDPLLTGKICSRILL